MAIQFEMGNIDVRQACFDHHSEIPHSQAFIAKMASVQLIEWFVMTGQSADALKDMEFNHFGHIDDLVALTLCLVADDIKAVQALYRFATSASVLDSCGPAGYRLVSKAIHETESRCRNIYHGELKAMGTVSYKASLEQKRAAMEVAAASLAREVMEKTCTPADVKLVPLEKGKADVEDKNFGGLKVTSVTVTDPETNIFNHADWFYSLGSDVVVSLNNGSFSILAASVYAIDLSGLWAELSKIEKNGTWGGHAGAGGSPRNTESSLSMSEVLQVVEDYLK